jgi:hypothetical protein
MTAGSLPRWLQPGEARTVTAVSEAACGGPVPVTGAMTFWHGMRSPVYDVMPAPPAIWRLSGLDRNYLSAITHLTQSHQARRRSRAVPDTTIPGRPGSGVSAAHQQYK